MLELEGGDGATHGIVEGGFQGTRRNGTGMTSSSSKKSSTGGSDAGCVGEGGDAGV